MLECPSIVCSVFGFIPPAIHLVANVCRNTYMENLRIPILSHCLNSMVSYVLFLTVVPFLHRKTYSDHSIGITLTSRFFLLLCRLPDIRFYHSITGIFHNHIILVRIIKHIKQCYPCLINSRCVIPFINHAIHNHLALNRLYF